MSGFGRKGSEGGGPAIPASGNGLDALRNTARPASAGITPASRRVSEQPRDSYDNYDYSGSFGSAKPVKHLWLAYLLWWFAGGVSAHRFYLGAYQSACVQLGFLVFGLAFVFMGEPWSYLGGFLFIIWAFWILLDVVFTYTLHKKLSAHGSVNYAQQFS